MQERGRSASVVLLAALLCAAGCRHGASGADAPLSEFAWVGNRIGISEEVPAPWTALKLSGSVVEYWGGRIEFAGSGLPRQVTSRGAELLSRPVALSVRADGGEVRLSDGALEAITAAAASVKLAGSSSTPQVAVRCEATVEFDGMVRIDAAITATEAVRLESVTLELPLRPESAALYRRRQVYDFETMRGDREDLKRAAGSVRNGWTSPFTPYVWVGAPEAGLEWFCESDEAWRPLGSQSALALMPAREETVLQARMIAQPLSLRRGETWRITFGLSPTPNRPRLPDWRTYRWGGRMNGPPIEVDTGTHHVFSIFWINESGGLALKDPGMPWPADPVAYRAVRADLARRRILYVPYGSLLKMDTSVPEWRTFGTEWFGGRKLAGWRSREAEGSRASSVDLTAQSYQDFVVHTYSEMVREYGIDGLYFDFGVPSINAANPDRPESRLAGRGIQSIPLFALRDFYKRLYVATEGQKPGFLTIVHGMLPAMCSSFVDANVLGEGLQSLFETSGGRYGPDYVDALPVEWYVAEMARSVAEFPLLIPEITKRETAYFRAHPKEVEAYTRGMIAVAVASDTHAIWLTNADNALLQRFSAAKARFAPLGDDCAFHPFWRSPVRIEPATAGLYPTLYTLPDHALLILSNLGGTAANVTVDPGLAGLGVKPTAGVATDAMTGAVIPLTTEGKVSLAVPAKDFVVVVLS